jgi:hypothetical protein
LWPEPITEGCPSYAQIDVNRVSHSSSIHPLPIIIPSHHIIMFFQGDLQAGIAEAIASNKNVVCFVCGV